MTTNKPVADTTAKPADNPADPAAGALVWRQYLLEQYQHDAECAITRALGGEPDQRFIERLLELFRTYIETPGVGESPQLADASILRLAHIVAGRIVRMGYWRQMDYLWPKLCTIAEFTGDADLYINFAKYLAIVKGRQTDGQAGFVLYQQLIAHAHFQRAAPDLQADILCHYATHLLWGGQRKAAAPLLQRCLTLTQPYRESWVAHDAAIPYDRRINTGAGPLWEVRAYALNQQGVLHMFCGEFASARQRFAEMLTIFLTWHEDDNLACVAYQAIGRLLLYAGNYREALTTLDQGLRIRQQREDREGIAVNSIYLAAAHLGLRQHGVAETLLAPALDACRALDNTHDLALCHLYLGELAFQQGQYTQARTHWAEVTTIATQVILHFVELRPWLRYLLPLLGQGELALCRCLIATLWRSARQDQLSLAALWRFCWI